MTTPRCRASLHWPLLFGLVGIRLLVAPTVAFAGPPALFADRFTWSGFVHYWSSYVHGSNQVLQVAGLVLVAALFIITRGKWAR